jgi:Fic family protein
MIVSYDTIITMNPPYSLTPQMLSLVGKISHILGRLDNLSIMIPEPKLRKINRIRTVKATLAIEGNTFSEEQITAILDNKKVVGSKKEILEVKNAIQIYDSASDYKSTSVKSFLEAHSKLMKELVETSGKFRSKNVGVLKGKVVKHVAPKPAMVPELMKSLFDWIKIEKELHPLIKSSIVHYEIEFIHPFEDGNGRMGRFWQSLLLAKFNPVFKFVPVESLVEKNQQRYYDALEESDKSGTSNPFIEFMLQTILESLEEYDLSNKGSVITSSDRLLMARNHFEKKSFTRKEYMDFHKTLSSATASRDLLDGVKSDKLEKTGIKNQTRYKFC